MYRLDSKLVALGILLIAGYGSIVAEDAPVKPLTETIVEASGQAEIGEQKVDYRVQSGTLIVKDESGKDKASLFYTAYFLRGQPSADRPITFCFNGGPGASSVWLNVGLAGPKKLKGKDATFLSAPYSLENNPSSFLDVTDLVFIDPPATGLSHQTPGIDNKAFFGLEEDIDLMASFIKLFTIKVKRWDSPKYIMGESYGGLRAAYVAYQLHDQDAYFLNGLILVSPALDMQTICWNLGNDLPSYSFWPAYEKTAQFHKKAKETSGLSAEQFARTRLAPALMLGSLQEPKDKEQLAQEMADRIGVSKEFVLENNLRIPPSKFRKELLKNQELVVGRFDSLMTGASLGELGGDYDPSLEAIFGAMTAAFNQYLGKELKWPEIKEYKSLVAITNWNWGKGNQYVTAYRPLKGLLIQNPDVKVLVAMGEYDLAIPSFANEYMIQHMDLSSSQNERIVIKKYPSGHMFYLNPESLVDFKKEVLILYKEK